MNVEPLDIRGQLVRLFTAGCIDTRRRRKPRTRSAVCGAPSSTARLSDALALVDSSAAEMTVVTVAERPDLLGRGWERTRDTLPEYDNHGDVLNVYWAA
jgi:hypothetical protein